MNRHLPEYRTLKRIDNGKLLARQRFADQFSVNDWYRTVIPEAFPEVLPDDVRVIRDEYGNDFFVADREHILVSVDNDRFDPKIPYAEDKRCT